jgi:hypothetical protein
VVLEAIGRGAVDPLAPHLLDEALDLALEAL